MEEQATKCRERRVIYKQKLAEDLSIVFGVIY